MTSRSRGAMRPRFAFISRPLEGVGNAGCLLHPQPRVHFVLVERTFAVRSNISRQRAVDRSQVPKNPPCDPIARKTLPRPSHPVPYVRDDRETPLCVGQDGGSCRCDLGCAKTEIFLQRGLDYPNHIEKSQQITAGEQTPRGDRSISKLVQAGRRYVPSLRSESTDHAVG
jgi:hypothetical protein